MSRWILERLSSDIAGTAPWAGEMDRRLMREAFDHCGSPQEWEEFLSKAKGEPLAESIFIEWRKMLELPQPKLKHKPVVLPDF